MEKKIKGVHFEKKKVLNCRYVNSETTVININSAHNISFANASSFLLKLVRPFSPMYEKMFQNISLLKAHQSPFIHDQLV